MSRHTYQRLFVFALFMLLMAFSACSGGSGNPDGDILPDGDGETDGDDSGGDGDSEAPDGDGGGDVDKDVPVEEDAEAEDDAEPDNDDNDADIENDGDLEPDSEPQNGATLEIDPAPISIEAVELGSSGDTTVTLRNVQKEEGGQVALTVSAFALTTSSSKDISVGPGCAVPFELAAGAEQNCTLMCSPKTPREKTATLRVVASDGISDPKEQRVRVSCGVLHQISYVDPTLLEFGFTPRGFSQKMRFFVANPASVDLEIADVRLSDNTPDSFKLSFPEKTLRDEILAPNELVAVEVTYLPTANRNEFGLLEIESNDPYVPLRSIPITGRAAFACMGDTPNLQGDTCTDVCIPFERVCEYDEDNDVYSVKVCAADGSAWGQAEECDDGLICLDGYCILKACEASALMCRENGVLSCAEDELSFVTEDNCGADDLCTERSCTPGIGCSEESTASRCDDGNGCTTDSCNPDAGCRFEFNTNSCHDGNACTTGDICRLGVCRGTMLSCDDGNVCTADSCDSGATSGNPCRHDNIEGSCSDSSACTVNDTCLDGLCVGDSVVCNDGNICTSDSCNPLSGCVYTANSSACDDNNACTENDVCFNKICKGTAIAYNDGLFCNGIEQCDPQSGVSSGAAPSCDDGLSCTQDTCSNSPGRCQHNPVNSLCDDLNPCTSNICSASLGCIYQPVANGTPCDYLPGVAETCYEGLCSHACTRHSDCADGNECTEDNCDFSVGMCRNVPRDDVCQDDQVCNGEEICNPVAGCISGEILHCDDGVSCTNDYCSESDGGCVHVSSNASCNDNNVCTVDICNAATGCQYVEIGRECSDGNVCTIGDHCFGGICSSGSGVLSCDDGNLCTSEVCDPKAGCLYSNNALPCDDGNSCTPASYCRNGQCAEGENTCNDGVFCNGAESCTPGGSCTQSAPPDCDDKIACTHDECDSGLDTCTHSPVNQDCNDDNPCTVEYCDAANGCVYEDVEDGITCPNGYCYQGLCARPCSINADCNDGIACTSDICDTAVGLCTHGVNNAACRNNIYCDGEEYCDVLKGCRPGTPVDCEDGLACTRNTCTESGCITETTSYCNDGNSCTQDICDTSLNPQTTPSGCRYSALSDTGCSDGNACTVDDVCVAGQCKGSAKNCSDSNPCTADSCGLNGQCTSVQLTNGSACGSGKVCLWGNCVTGCSSDSECSQADDIACTVNLCSRESFECISIPVDQLCDDGLFCNGQEHCDAQQGCVGGSAIDCNDGIGCTADRCDEKQQKCLNTPSDAYCADSDPCVDAYCSLTKDCVYYNTSSSCSDGNPCTVNDVCSDGICSGSTSTALCNDGNACTADSCDPEFGCRYVDISFECDDDNVCTEDYCSPKQGCMHTAVESLACDDNNVCTETNYCENGQCTGFTTLDCNDYNPCTTDSCAVNTGCSNSYLGDGASCDSGVLKEGEICHGGICTVACLHDSDCNDEIACTLDSCQGGYCAHVPQNSVCDDGVFCNGAEVCIVNYGCKPAAARNCDDGIECTRDRCDSGLDECVNQFTSEICDDSNPCTADTCGASGCSNEPLSGISCDDGNLCTVNDTCSSGHCSGQARACDDYNECTGPDTCDPGVGCRYPLLENGLECGEADSGMACQGGICTKSCSYDYQCDDGVECTRDICDRQTHICRFETRNSLCDDGLFCNGSEQCHPTLGCLDAAAGPCDDGVFCTQDSCNEANDTCGHEPVNSRCEDYNDCTSQTCNASLGCVYSIRSGAACNDGDPCTATSKCSPLGYCMGQTLTDCSTGDTCRMGSCDPRYGCVENLRPEGTVCNSQDSCGINSQCVAGYCTPKDYLSCDDNKQCTIDSCTDTGCLNFPEMPTVSCNDGLRCTTEEYCFNSQCNSVPVSCNDNNECTADSCSEADGCSHTPANEGQSCYSARSGGRTPAGVCRQGACVGICSTPEDCNDGIACTLDFCDGGMCRHVAQNALCDDGKYCNGAELCLVDQGCLANLPVECGDNTECTSDYCDENSDSCVNEDSGSCDDGNPCTLDSCSSGSGCAHQKLDGVACDDGNVCTLGGVCVQGSCTSLQAVHCDDGNPCTKDQCNPTTGCSFVPLSGVDCNDGNLCTIMDVCNAGKCVGTAADCNDNNQCTYDYCKASVGCINRPLTAVQCDDGNACTSGDKCFNGQCNGYESIQCDDGNPCTLNRCLPGQGCVFPAITGGNCKR